MPNSCSDEMNVFAQSTSGEMLHISEVTSGLKCNCTCPGCDEPMIAYKGSSKKAHYFGHRAGSACKGGGETALHRFAKEVLNTALEFTLPPVDLRVDDKSETVINKKAFRFDRAELEKRTSDIIPDVVVYLKDRPLLVEMFVTHKCDDVKIEKIVKLGMSAIEIDLSKVSQKDDLSVWKKAVLHSAPRTWLYNKAVEDAEQRAQALADARRAEALEARHQALAAVAAEIATLRQMPATFQSYSWKNVIEGFDFHAHADVALAGDFLFNGNPGLWKSHVIDHYVYGMMDTPSPEAKFESKNVLSSLHKAGLIKRGIPDVSVDDLPHVQALAPDFRPVFQVLEAYLNHLVEVRLLERSKGFWIVHKSVQSSYDDANERLWMREERTDEVKTAVTRLLDLLPAEDRKEFDFEGWLHTAQPTLDGASILECINSDHDDFGYPFYSLLRMLEAMVTGKGEIADQLLNLPLVAARNRQIQRARQEAEVAERERERELLEARQSRIKTLEDYVGTWPTELSPSNWVIAPDDQLKGRTPRSQAEESDLGLHKAMELARSVYATWQSKADEEAKIASWRRRIMAVADQEALAVPAKIWLTTSNPRYGGQRPIEMCTNEAAFSEMCKYLRADMKMFKGSRY